MVTLAIIGSRSFTDYELLCTTVENQCIAWDIKLSEITYVVGGHCENGDLLGEQFAQQNKIKPLILKPNWKKHGRNAGFIRNYDIIKAATHVIAFPSKDGSRTQHSIKLAKKAAKPMLCCLF